MNTDILKGIRKVLEVFSEEYKEETRYREFMESNKERVKLKSTKENIDKKIKVLSNNNFKSDFNVKIGSYE